jgi:hypothetical protein
MQYNAEATKLQGGDAILDFPSTCNPSRASTGTDSQLHGVPAGGGHGQELPATTGLLPAGTADGPLVRAPATFTSKKSRSGVS